MSTSIEKISLIALTGIFIAVISLFLGHADENNNLTEQSGNSSTAHPEERREEGSLQSHLDSARSYFEKNDYIYAISEYRKVIEIDPNYIDEKSKLFLGDEIKNAIKKTIFELTEKEKITPGDKNIKQGLKDAYFMRRRFGRGCE